VYRFLATPRWLGLAALMLLLAVIMVGLGDWQLHRYRERSAINDRIDAAATATPTPLASAVPGPGTARLGRRAPDSAEWARVRANGVYDAGREVLARGRTVDGAVGFEVLTPLVLPDGSAVIVDRGWVPAPAGGALVAPQVPVAPAGPVTVVGRVRLPESGADQPVTFDGHPSVRRIAPARLAAAVPYPLFDAYVTLDSQTPAADRRFTSIPTEHENAWQNAGYVVQWWAFALLTVIGYVRLARKEARAQTDEEQPVPV
jgi:cytochrome oxidase assembly protein ShyY1